MINRDMKTVSVKSFTDGVDSYGIPRKTVATTRYILGALYDYSNSETDDIRYQEVTKILLTKDTSVTDQNQINLDNQDYNILYVRPSKRYTTLYLREV